MLIDRWDKLVSENEGAVGFNGEELAALLEDGRSVGIGAVVTGGRSTLGGRIRSAATKHIVLRFPDAADLVRADLDADDLPASLPPGGGIDARTRHRVQFATMAAPDQSSGPASTWHELDTRWRRGHPTTKPPRRVRPLPTHVTLSAVQRPDPARPFLVTLGVAAPLGEAATVDLADTNGVLLIAGPRRSGRSTAANTVARSLAANGVHVIGLAGRSPLAARFATGFPGTVLAGDSLQEERLRDALDGVQGPAAVVIDDVEGLAKGWDSLSAIVQRGLDRQRVLVAAGTTDDLRSSTTAFVREARRAQAALILTPMTPMDGELAGKMLQQAELFAEPPLRGVLGLRRSFRVVQVADS